MKNDKKPTANPLVVLREEFDDWAILFDPDTGTGFGLNPSGVYVWKNLDGEKSIDEMLKALHRDAQDVPEGAGAQISEFVEDLVKHGLAGYELEQIHERKEHLSPCRTHVPEKPGDAMKFTYETPKLINLIGDQPAQGAYCKTGHTADPGCVGGGTNYCCSPGSSASSGGCGQGACASLCTANGAAPGTCAPFGSGLGS
jgi:SynChlorMet cassette protein ScmD